MPNLMVFIQPETGSAFIQADFSDQSAVDTAWLMRTYDSLATPADTYEQWSLANIGDYPPGTVRPNTATDPVYGFQAVLNGPYGFWFDTEAPMDVPFYYNLYDLNNTGLGSTQFGPFVIPSDKTFWLRNPQAPANDVAVVNSSAGNPQCVPLSGVYFSSMDVEARASASTEEQIDNSPYAVIAARQRLAIASTLTLVTKTFDDRDNLIEMCQPGEPLLFQAPPQYGINDTYMSVGDLSVTRGLSDHRRQWRVAALPFITANRPVGLQGGMLGARWEDACQTYVTYNDVAAANITTLQLINGYASFNPNLFQTWNQVKDLYANWTAVGAKTWQQILQGS